MNGSDPAAVLVLVTDDEAGVRFVAVEMLAEAGYRVIEASDGREALEILEDRSDVQALFTDIAMPRLDGLALARIVRERWPQIAILVTSAHPPRLPDGVRFLQKPYRAERLIATLEEVLSSEPPTRAAALSRPTTPTLSVGEMRGGGGLAQPLPEPEE